MLGKAPRFYAVARAEVPFSFSFSFSASMKRATSTAYVVQTLYLPPYRGISI